MLLVSGDALLASLSVTTHVCPGAKMHVAARQSGELGDTKASLDRKQHQGVVATASPVGAARAAELFSSNECPAFFSYLDVAPEMEHHFGCLEVQPERRAS